MGGRQRQRHGRRPRPRRPRQHGLAGRPDHDGRRLVAGHGNLAAVCGPPRLADDAGDGAVWRQPVRARLHQLRAGGRGSPPAGRHRTPLEPVNGRGTLPARARPRVRRCRAPPAGKPSGRMTDDPRSTGDTTMTKPALEIAALAAALGVLPAPPAGAVAPTKAWVSNAGVDSGTCGAVAAPCATFQQAHDNLAGGGAVGHLTPGDYGKTSSSVRLTISKTVFITNDGSGEASVLVGTGGTGIQINGGNGDLVNLRGLVIDGQLGGLQGIAFLTGSALHVQNCVIRNFE